MVLLPCVVRPSCPTVTASACVLMLLPPGVFRIALLMERSPSSAYLLFTPALSRIPGHLRQPALPPRAAVGPAAPHQARNRPLERQEISIFPKTSFGAGFDPNSYLCVRY